MISWSVLCDIVLRDIGKHVTALHSNDVMTILLQDNKNKNTFFPPWSTIIDMLHSSLCTKLDCRLKKPQSTEVLQWPILASIKFTRISWIHMLVMDKQLDKKVHCLWMWLIWECWCGNYSLFCHSKCVEPMVQYVHPPTTLWLIGIYQPHTYLLGSCPLG